MWGSVLKFEASHGRHVREGAADQRTRRLQEYLQVYLVLGWGCGLRVEGLGLMVVGFGI